MRVLIVEDERRMASYIGRALSEEGFSVDIATDGAEGLVLARAHEYDAIVLDLMLPKVDGLSVCRTLRCEGRQTPVLILSARDMLEDRVRGLDAGADDYLVKPFALVELSARLRAMQRRGRRAAPTSSDVGDSDGIRRPAPCTVGAARFRSRRRVRAARVFHAARRGRADADDDRRARLGLHFDRQQRRRRLRQASSRQD